MERKRYIPKNLKRASETERTHANSAVPRLRKLFDDHPEAYGEWSLTRMSREIGVSKERVRQLLPDYVKNDFVVRKTAKEKLMAYVREYPEALKPNRRGFGYGKIAKHLEESEYTVRKAWIDLGLPNRKIKYTPEQAREKQLEKSRENYRKHKAAHHELVKRWKAQHPEKTRGMNLRGQRRYNTKRSLEYCESPAICEEMRLNGRIDLTCRRHQKYFEWHPEKVNHVLPAQN